MHSQSPSSQASSSTSSTTLGTRYLINVENTLMINATGELNLTFIEWLKENKIIRIDLLTNFDMTMPTYHTLGSLLQFLKEQGITVIKVITPLDLLYQQEDQSYQAGIAYKKNRETIEAYELALLDLKKVMRKKSFDQFQAALLLKKEITTIKLLITLGVFNGATLLKEIGPLIKQKFTFINDPHLFLGFLYSDPDLLLINTLVTSASSVRDELKVQDFLNDKETSLASQQELLSVNRENFILKRYTQALYSFRYSIAQLKNTNIATPHEVDELSPQTKENLYSMYVSHNMTAQETIVFIDNAKSDRETLESFHRDQSYPHQLVTADSASVSKISESAHVEMKTDSHQLPTAVPSPSDDSTNTDSASASQISESARNEIETEINNYIKSRSKGDKLNWTSEKFRDTLLTREKIKLAGNLLARLSNINDHESVRLIIEEFIGRNKQLEIAAKKTYFFFMKSSLNRKLEKIQSILATDIRRINGIDVISAFDLS